MMRGGFFDNMWDPYSGAYAYPRTQPKAQYYRPRANVQPEFQASGKEKVEDSARKSVRTIPVTDGSAHVEVKVKPVEVKAQPIVWFKSEEAAARKIQAVYRGHSVRRTEPLKHLRVIVKVTEEFEGLKRRLEDRDVRVRVAGDAQERLRWTEGIMALLLRLDQLQGVHPEVRVFRKAAAKELLMLQEKLDSMSTSVAEESVGVDDSVGEEESEVCHAAEERAGSVVSSDIHISAVEAVAKIEVEEEEKYGEVNADDASVEGALATDAPREEMEQDAAPLEESKGAMLVEESHAVANDAPYLEMDQDAPPLEEWRDGSRVEVEGAHADNVHRETMEHDAASVDEIKDREHAYDGVEGEGISSSEPRVPKEEDLCSEEQSDRPSERIEESMVEDAELDGLEFRVPAGVPMDVEVEASKTAPLLVEDGSSQSAPVTGVDKEEVSGADDAPPFELEGVSLPEEAESPDSKNENQARLASAAENNGDDPLIHEERVIDSGDGWIVPASPSSLDPNSLQVGESNVSAPGGTNSLSDRALLEQLLDENRKLNDVVGKVLHWGKRQNDIIHSLASRIEHLEEKLPHANMLPGEQMNGRKRICNDGCGGGDRARSQRSKGRRRGGQQNMHQLAYLDSEWLSPDSDEYF